MHPDSKGKYMTSPNMYIFPNNNFVDLTIYQFGHQDCPPLHNSGPATCGHFLFHYVHHGKGVFFAENEQNRMLRYEIEAGQGFMIWPKKMYSYTADEKEPWSYSWVEFDGLKAKQMVLESGVTENNPVYNGKSNVEQKKMVDAISYIAHNPAASPPELIGYCFLFLSNLVDSSVNRKKVARSSIQDFYVSEVLLYIETHYHKNIRVEDIATLCNLDRSHVGKIFKSTMGMSLRDYLIRYRINKACELIKGTNYSIGEIGEMAGYPNMFNFSRAFKSIMGMSPRQWRNENKLRD